MRPLTRNERMLSLAVGTCVFLIANMLGVRWIAGELRAWRADIVRLKTEVAAAKQVMLEEPYWHARQAWMENHPLPRYDEEQSLANFLEEMRAGLKQRNLKIESQQPMAPEVLGSLATVDVALKVEGRLEDIVRWLHAVQQPGEYLLVRKFKLNQASGKNTMELDITLGRVFRTGDIASSP